MKKIGKNNPKAADIIADNQARKEWNQAVDVALVEGVPEADIKEGGNIKKGRAVHSCEWKKSSIVYTNY